MLKPIQCDLDDALKLCMSSMSNMDLLSRLAAELFGLHTERTDDDLKHIEMNLAMHTFAEATFEFILLKKMVEKEFI